MKKLIYILVLALCVSSCSIAVKLYYLNKSNNSALLITKPSIELIYGEPVRKDIDLDSIILKRINPYNDSLGMYRIKANEKILLRHTSNSCCDKFPFEYVKIIQNNDTMVIDGNNFKNKIKRYKGRIGGIGGGYIIEVDDK